ncbi:PREDICTED: tetraspanin-3-like [Crocodylus porosus]|uniref:tetraspanin-3-like n=1 Tax=Crocodylus porosus TaxID=8502 RepID=UPI00093BDA09|nr:PREDICTED: tetraspanin-3-like [Crocodylus porosus]
MKGRGRRFTPCFLPLYCTMDSWIRPFARVLLILLGLVLWGAAAALAFGGAFVILTYKNYRWFFQNCFLLLPGWLAVVAAFLLLPTGALAIGIPARNSRYQQGTFMYLLVVLFCLEASVAMLAHIYPDKMGSELKGTLGHLFHQYNGTHSHCPSNRAVDIIQKQLQCCGVYNYTDWVKAALPVSCHLQARSICVPESCCKETFHCSGDVNQSAQLFQEGCLKKLNYRLHFVMHFVFWCCAVLACLQVLAAISNGILMKHRPFQDLRILDSAVFS